MLLLRRPASSSPPHFCPLDQGDFPREPYVGWSPQDLHGYRWLHCLDPPVCADESSLDAREIIAES